MKKLPILLVATAILLAGFGYLYKSNQENDPMEGIPDTAALEEEFENKQAQQENNNKNSNEQQGSITQDPVYRYTNNLIAQLNPYPICVTLGQAMRNIASSNAPDHIRERQIDKIFSKMPDMCIRH